MKAEPAEYELVRPGSLAGVLALMADAPGAYTPMAGGTELMVQFGAGRLRTRKLVDVFGLPELVRIELGEREITIGAGVTYTTLRRHAELAAALPLLVRAAGWTGAIANQNRGTLGGNVVNGSPAADSPPALLAYGAEISLVSARGMRRLAYADFHTGYKQSVLAADELMLALHLPRRVYTHGYLRKVGARQAQAISKVALGAVANVVAGRVRDCRIGLASVSHSPYRCRAAEAVLNGAELGPETVAQARTALLAEIAPLDDIRSTGKYRAQVSANLLGEFLAELAGAAG